MKTLAVLDAEKGERWGSRGGKGESSLSGEKKKNKKSEKGKKGGTMRKRRWKGPKWYTIKGKIKQDQQKCHRRWVCGKRKRLVKEVGSQKPWL